jgi:predicted nucleotidyltransferase
MSVSVEESARTFRERALRARAERERRAADLRVEVEHQLRALLPPGARAWLIGSLVWGGFGERSDVDLVVAGLTGSQATLLEDAVSRASGVEVDVLQLDELPAPFRRRVELEGVRIHGC